MTTLKCVHRYNSDQNRINLIFVLIPELSRRIDKSVISTLIAIEPCSIILEFNYTLKNTGSSIWASLLHTADTLIDALLALGPLTSPVVYLSHGLGGIITKRMLGVLDLRYTETNYNRLLNSVAGLVFLSTPHLTFSKQDYWPQVQLVYQCCVGNTKVQHQSEVETIVSVCIKFEETYGGIFILSAYESKKTKLSEGFMRAKRVLLVGEAVAVTGAPGEELIEVEADHMEIGEIRQGSILERKLKAFLTRIREQRFRFQPQPSDESQHAIEPDQGDNATWASTASQIAIEDGQRPTLDDSRGMPRWNSTDATRGSDERPYPDTTALMAEIPGFRPNIQLPCFFLQSNQRNVDFYGRDDILLELDRVLLPDNRKSSLTTAVPVAFAISGLGGMGKTQCAIEYAFRRADKFDAVLWARADTAAKLDESFSQISVALGLETAAKAGDRVVSRNLVMEWLSVPVRGQPAPDQDQKFTNDKANWLLVFDNADDVALLTDFWPSSGPGAIIVTSRDPLARRHFRSQGVDLDVLGTDSGAALLRNLCGAGDSPEEMEGSAKVATRLQGLPLAITIAAGTILRGDLLFNEFIGLLDTEPQAADIKPFSLRSETQYQHTLSTVWSGESLPKSARHLLAVLSVLDPDSILEQMLTQNVALDSSLEYPKGDSSFVNARTELLKCSLIKRNKTAGQITVHRLTQEFTRISLSTEIMGEVFALAIQLCHNYWPKPVVAGGWTVSTWPASDAVAPHLFQLRSLWQKTPSIIKDVSVKHNLADLCWRVAWHLTERGAASDDVLSLLHTADQICESEPQLRHNWSHGRTFFAFSAVDTFENRPKEAYEYACKAVEVNIQLNPDLSQDQYLGIAHNQLGKALLANDKWEEAEAAFRDSLRVYAEWVEVKDRDYKPEFPWVGLAEALLEQGKIEEAATIIEDVIAWRAKRFGPDDVESLKFGLAMQALEKIRRRQGRLDESLIAAEKCLNNFKATTGALNFRTAQAYSKLGEHYTMRNEHDKADSHFQAALKIYSSRPCYKAEIARTVHKQALLYDAKPDLEETARVLHSRAVQMYREIVGNGEIYTYGATIEQVDFDQIVNLWAR